MQEIQILKHTVKHSHDTLKNRQNFLELDEMNTLKSLKNRHKNDFSF
jgi:hypothetical protein